MSDHAGDKTLDPTLHRRQQARSEGHVAKSQELASAVLMLAGLAALMTLGGGLVGFVSEYCRDQLGGEAWLSADAQFAVDHWNATLWTLGRCTLPILGMLCLVGVAIHVLQSGFLFLPQRLAWDFGRLSPLRGMQRIVSGSNMVHLGLGAAKFAVAGTVAVVVLYKQRDAILGMTDLAPAALAVQMTHVVLWTAVKVVLALLVLAVFDYAFQWWRNEQDLKMTPQELREELRNLEGNPQVIARRKRVQRDLVLRRLSASVPEANVVVTNPSQLAIAVRFDPETMASPVVVAKGAGASAEHIRRVAAQCGVPTIEQKQLARAIYRRVDPNHPIPADQYVPMAKVLLQARQTKK